MFSFHSADEEIESQRSEVILLRSHREQTIVGSNRSHSKVDTFSTTSDSLLYKSGLENPSSGGLPPERKRGEDPLRDRPQNVAGGDSCVVHSPTTSPSCVIGDSSALKAILPQTTVPGSQARPEPPTSLKVEIQPGSGREVTAEQAALPKYGWRRQHPPHQH